MKSRGVFEKLNFTLIWTRYTVDAGSTSGLSSYSIFFLFMQKEMIISPQAWLDGCFCFHGCILSELTLFDVVALVNSTNGFILYLNFEAVHITMNRPNEWMKRLWMKTFLRTSEKIVCKINLYCNSNMVEIHMLFMLHGFSIAWICHKIQIDAMINYNWRTINQKGHNYPRPAVWMLLAIALLNIEFIRIFPLITL